jgi:hypothetical protein
LNGWKVHGVANDAAPEKVTDGGGGLNTHQFLRFFGRCGDVGRGQHLGQLRK